MYAGLLRLGKAVTLVRYHGESHEISQWARENVEDYWTRTIAWFDRYLKGPLAP
jgi:dipeptidyl aminopeptidase/acylaminoacyl peptidase